jgi:hypothetical protein
VPICHPQNAGGTQGNVGVSLSRHAPPWRATHRCAAYERRTPFAAPRPRRRRSVRGSAAYRRFRFATSRAYRRATRRACKSWVRNPRGRTSIKQLWVPQALFTPDSRHNAHRCVSALGL